MPITSLPVEISELASLAADEGFRHLQRLIEDFESGANTFSAPGEILCEVRVQKACTWHLAGIGGLNVDPFKPDGRTGRIRRVYIHPHFRRRGLGRLLMAALEQHARGHFGQLLLFTTDANAAEFYTQLGYQSVHDHTRVSHRKQL